jgi:hypothetical protein
MKYSTTAFSVPEKDSEASFVCKSILLITSFEIFTLVMPLQVNGPIKTNYVTAFLMLLEVYTRVLLMVMIALITALEEEKNE